MAAQVGATCFGVSHAMLKSKVFDVCILDEAGQITLPASLGEAAALRRELYPPAACAGVVSCGVGGSGAAGTGQMRQPPWLLVWVLGICNFL